MKERKSLLKRIEQKKLYQWLIFLILMSIIWITYYLIKEPFIKVNDDFSWVCQVDSIEKQEEDIVLSGFAFELGKNAEEKTFEVILYDIETEKAYYPKMKYSLREDVNDYFLCEYDYTKSGFIATISLKKLNLENKVYEVLLRPDGKKKAYSIGVYYANGEMVFVNPKDFVTLNVEGTDLEKVIEEGVLRVYRPDYGMYVYQYEGDLYWIAEEWYDFVDNNTYIQFQMNTTQVNKLPKDRIENNWLWSNLGFEFGWKELISWNTGIYRVAKVQLPIKYSITKIWTGNYKNGWLWKNDFRPWYEFGEE